MKNIESFQNLAEKIIDLSADFRLNDTQRYQRYYHDEHSNPDLLSEFIYGIPELYRNSIENANYVSSAGCNATVSILTLKPLIEAKLIDTTRIFIDVKVGTSEAGNKVNDGSHHPERVRSMRSYKPTQHRHVAEIEQELGDVNVYFSATSVDMVRGVLATIQTFVNDGVDEKAIWKTYRNYYRDDPFVRIVKEKTGNFRYPDPKTLVASNFCDIGFELDKSTNRLVLIGAIDNLMKGAAGQAVQVFNIMHGFPEKAGLTFPGIHLY